VIYINTDGGIDKDRGYCAFVVKDEHENYIGSLSKIVSGTSNECEYHGIIFALETLYSRGFGLGRNDEATIRSDSRLVLEQIQGRWKCKEPRLQVLNERVNKLLKSNRNVVFNFQQIPRSRNKEADYLCNLCKVEGPKTEFSSPLRG
jgi:probable phosphoglycerate mutase